MRTERGFALIGALWLIVIVSAVGLEMSLAAKARRQTALNVAEFTQAAWAARAGMETARGRLERLLREPAASTGDPWWNAAAFVPDTTSVGDATFVVTARDANAALHLNRANEAEFQALFQALRIDAGDADRLAQAIADWRDADDLHRARGAERPQYLSSGAVVLPRNGPFRSVGELQDVRGMSPELFDRIRPHLTVVGTGRVNLNAAPRPVLLALPGVTDEAVRVIERRRAGGQRIGSVQELTSLLSSPTRARIQAEFTELLARATFVTQELEVESIGWTGDGRVTAKATGLAVRARQSLFLIGVRVE